MDHNWRNGSPTAEAIKTDLIENILFTFRKVSCLDYHWVNDCSLFNPEPKKESIIDYPFKDVPRLDDGRSYFAHRDYDLVIDKDGNVETKLEATSSDWNVIPAGYIHSHRKLWELDGTTNYEYQSSLKLEFELLYDFQNLSKDDIQMLKDQTMMLVTTTGIDKDQIRSLTINRPFIADMNRFKENDWDHAFHRSYIDWVLFLEMEGRKSDERNNKTSIEVTFIPSFDKIKQLVRCLSKWFVFNISFGSLVGRINYDYQSNSNIGTLSYNDETGTDYSRKKLEYTKNACIWELLDCRCSSSGLTCLKAQNEGQNRNWYRHGFVGKIISLGTCNTLAERIEKINEE